MPNLTTEPVVSPLSWRIGGMDCAGCAAKIRGALERMPGVSDVRLSVMTETLTLALDEDKTSRTAIETQVSGLGYSVKAIEKPSAKTAGAEPPSCGCGHDHHKNDGHNHGHTRGENGKSVAKSDKGPKPDAGQGQPGHVHEITPEGMSWYQTGKGRLVLGTGSLLAAAWGAKFLAPGIANWAFIAACLIGVAPIALRAFAALRAGMPFTIEMLMTIAAAGALVIGAAEEAALVVFLFAVGEVLEGVAANRARASIKALGDLVPKTAIIEEGGMTRQIDAATLEIGQMLLVRPGDRIPADGEIKEGTSGIDESPVTGESVPKTKTVGEPVFAGSINREAVLRVKVTKAAEDNTIARIIRLVEEAQEARAPTERFIDRFSRIYMPAIVGLAILVALVPPLALGGDWNTWIYRALALLLIGCPCALVISVPASIASALSAGARRGLLMKGGVVIEALARVKTVAFDKTGTLTIGKPVVTDIRAFDVEENAMLALTAGVETGSSHPLAEAILDVAEARGVKARPATEARAIVGRGVEARIDGELVFVGSPRFAAEIGALSTEVKTASEAFEAEGKTVAAVFKAGHVIGLLALRDEPREDAKSAIAELQALGVSSVMLTGDNARTGAAIAASLGMEHKAELMPDDKVTAIKALTATRGVMMVGDGISRAEPACWPRRAQRWRGPAADHGRYGPDDGHDAPDDVHHGEDAKRHACRA